MATTPYPFVSGAVLTANQLNSTFNVPVNNQTASYVLLASDGGKRVVMNAAGATTITVNTSLFGAGDSVWIHNIGAGTCTITAGTATVNTAAFLALAQWEGGQLYFTSAASAIFFRGAGAQYGVATGGSSSSITVSGVNYTLLTFTGDATLTVTKAGLFDIECYGGGGGGGGGDSGAPSRGGGGGGAGGRIRTTVYLDANQSVTVGGGGAGGAVQTPGSVGSRSQVGARLVMIGGGGGRADSLGIALANGGGGYGESGKTTGGTSILGTDYGNNGGTAVVNGAGGGGGGSTQVGQNGVTNTGGAGGAGSDVSTFIGGSSLFKAGGGGGAGSTAGGAGGSSVGGAGGTGAGSAAAANTAGGGGGSAGNNSGGAGGSGIVYVRFKV